MDRDPHGERAPRSVGLLGAVAVLVGPPSGAASSGFPATVAARVRRSRRSSWWPGSLGGVLALFGALTMAELAAMYPRSGGVFAYLEEGRRPAARPSCSAGPSSHVVRASALGGISTIFAEYLGYFMPLTPGTGPLRGGGADLPAWACSTTSGSSAPRAVINVATIAKYAALVVAGAAGLRHRRRLGSQLLAGVHRRRGAFRRGERDGADHVGVRRMGGYHLHVGRSEESGPHACPAPSSWGPC